MKSEKQRRYGSAMEHYELVPMVPTSRVEAREGISVIDYSVKVMRRRLDSRHMVMEVVQVTTQGSRMMMGVRRMGKRTWGLIGSRTLGFVWLDLNRGTKVLYIMGGLREALPEVVPPGVPPAPPNSPEKPDKPDKSKKDGVPATPQNSPQKKG
jgi:hypothetical protein